MRAHLHCKSANASFTLVFKGTNTVWIRTGLKNLYSRVHLKRQRWFPRLNSESRLPLPLEVRRVPPLPTLLLRRLPKYTRN